MTDTLCIDIVADDLFDIEYLAPVVDVTVPEPVAGVVVVDQAGPPGPAGDPGPPGPSFDGTAWWYGEGAPTTVIGSKAGDYYVDTTTGLVYELQ